MDPALHNRSVSPPEHLISNPMKRFVWPALACLLILAGVDSYGQVAMERVYADDEDHGGTTALGLPLYTVTDPQKAFDKDLVTHSTIGITLLGSVWQKLIFPEQAPAGTPVHIKVGTATDILELLGNIQVQAFINNTPAGDAIALSSLISLLAGEDQSEIVFTPMQGTTPKPYNSVRVISSGVALGGGFRIYDAYFYKSVTGPIACDKPLDLLYGSSGSIAAGLNGVSNPYNAIDNNYNSFADLNANVSVGNKTHVTALYPTLSSSGDSIRLVIQYAGSGLLDATVLANNFTIRTYNDNTANDPIDLNSNSLRLRLFPGSSDKQVLTYPVSQPFNRIEVSIGEGLAVALSGLNVYEIERISVGPTVLGLSDGQYEVCDGSTIDLAIDNPQSGYTYKWYTAPINGSPIATGPSYSPPYSGPGEYVFYVSATRTACTTESGRTMIVVKVNESAVAADVDVEANAPFCVEDDVELVPSSETVPDPVFQWYYDSGKAQPISNGTVGSVTYQIAADGTLTIQGLAEGLYSYYVSVSNATTCENSADDLKEVTVDVHAPPPEPIIELAPE